MVLVARRLWDGVSDECLEAGPADSLCLALDHGRIAYAGSLAALSAQWSAVERKDFGDCTIMPGLIDAHVHMESDPCFPLHDQPRLDEEALLKRMQVHSVNLAK